MNPNVRGRFIRVTPRTVLIASLAATLVACQRQDDIPDHPDWVLHFTLGFFTENLLTARAPLAADQYRLQFSYISGDLYGAPTTGDFLERTASAGGWRIDLNRSHRHLLKSLEPTEFNESYLSVQPAEARIARLAPLALQADGIEQVGRMEWIDADTRDPLLLVFFDRPALIAGETVSGGRPLRYDIRASMPGYVWIARQHAMDGDVFHVVPEPAHLALALIVDPGMRGDDHKRAQADELPR